MAELKMDNSDGNTVRPDPLYSQEPSSDSTSCFAQGLPQAFVHPWEDSNRSWQRIHLRAGPTSPAYQ